MTMLTPLSKCILVMAGGTGGHIFPGIAVAEYLRLEGWRIHWLGNPTGMEYALTQKHGFKFESIKFGGVRGKGFLVKVQLPFNLLKAMWQSYVIIRRIKPAVVLGMGGYVSFPGGLVASLCGIPLVLHEQNSIAGMANKVMAKFAKKVLCAFPHALPGSEWVGNPIRNDLLRLSTPEIRYANRSGPLKLLVIGGSLGASILNEIIPQAIALLPTQERPTILHQSGSKHLEQVKQNYAQLGLEVQIVPFIENMAQAYEEADIVICRAGAMTIAELAACGVPALLIPFPHAVDDHQTMNAQFLAKVGAANLIAQNDFQPEIVAQWLCNLDRKLLLEMAQKAFKQAKPFATRSVAEICKQVSEL